MLFNDSEIHSQEDVLGYWWHKTSSIAPHSTGGIGLLLSPRFQKALTFVRSVSDRILHAVIAFKTLKMHIFACYSPTSVNRTDSEAFYEQLRQIIWNLPRRDLIIIAGDLNASLPQGLRRAPFVMGCKNQNADLLDELMESVDMVAATSYCRKKPEKRITFRGPRQRRAALDHILIPWKWRRNIKDTVSLFPQLLTSDHALVGLRLRITDQLYRPPKPSRSKWNWFDLRKCETRRNFDACLKAMWWGRELSFDKVVQSIQKAAEECLPTNVRRTRPGLPWEMDSNIKAARLDLEACKRRLRIEENVSNVTNACRASERYRVVIDAYIDSEVNAALKEIALDTGGRQVKIAWRTLRKLTGKKRGCSLQIDGENPESRLKAAKDYFCNLYSPALPSMTTSMFTAPNCIEKASEASFNTGPATVVEVRKAANDLAPGRAPGVDGLPVECFRSWQVARQMAQIINKIMLENGEVPTQWGEAVVVPVPKKVGARTLDQHRGISLLNIAVKVYNRLLLSRLQPIIDPLLRPEQNGFRKGRSTVQHILALKRIIEEVEGHKLEAHLVFVDFKKAFDSISRGVLPSVLNAYGVPSKLQNAVCAMYKHTFVSVKTADGLTPTFDTTTGVLQGDVLAPFLFTLCMDCAMRSAFPDNSDGLQLDRRRSSRHAGRSISVMAYADDLVLMSSTREGVQRLLSSLEGACRPLGLVVNAEKTKALAFNVTDNTPIRASTGVVQVCKDFIYLGCSLPDISTEMQRRRGLAWAACAKLQPIWSSPASPFAKAKLFSATIEPLLMYGSEAWTLSAANEAALDGTHARLLRAAMGFAWPCATSTVEMFQIAQKKRLSQVLRERRRKILSNINNGKWLNVRPLCDVMFWCPGKATGKFFHRKISYLDMAERDAVKARMNLSEWMK
jgi:hypothetical protein